MTLAMPAPESRARYFGYRRKQRREELLADDDKPIEERLDEINIGARLAATMSLSLLTGLHFAVGCERVRDLANLLWYAEHNVSTGSRWKHRRRIMDIDAQVAAWADVIVGLSTSHDHQAQSEAEERSDELLEPILSAPIAQIREFAQKLAAILEEDTRVPFLVWSSFKRVVMPLVMRGPDAEAQRLHTELAREIAELVEHDLPRADLIAAIAGALQWRAGATLEKVKTQLQAGGTPRMRGRESCLFLQVDGVEDAASVLL